MTSSRCPQHPVMGWTTRRASNRATHPVRRRGRGEARRHVWSCVWTDSGHRGRVVDSSGSQARRSQQDQRRIGLARRTRSQGETGPRFEIHDSSRSTSGVPEAHRLDRRIPWYSSTRPGKSLVLRARRDAISPKQALTMSVAALRTESTARVHGPQGPTAAPIVT